MLQFAGICEQVGLRGAGVDAELQGFHAGFAFASTRDRSLLSSLNERKFALWLALEHGVQSLFEVAAQQWNGMFKHAALGRNTRHNTEYHRPLDLLRQHLQPAAQIIPFDRAIAPATR